jgi:hypothetical protein
VGLGVFLMKRKLVRRSGSSEVFLSVLDKWIALKVLQSRQVSCCLYGVDGNSQTLLQKEEDEEIDLGSCKLVIRRDLETDEVTIRRSDRRELWVLAGEERRVRAKDVLRLGLQLFEVEAVSSYI